MAYTSNYTGQQIDNCISTYQNSSDVTSIVNAAIAAAKLAMYPIGSIYMSIESTDPSTFIGGTWERIQDTFLLAAGTNFAAGSSGGEVEHTLTLSEAPAHTHTRGTMDITATLKVDPDNAWCQVSGGGAFTFDTTGKRATGGASGSTDVNTRAVFTASRTWSGATSSEGGGTAHNNMPPYLSVYIWKRIA